MKTGTASGNENKNYLYLFSTVPPQVTANTWHTLRGMKSAVLAAAPTSSDKTAKYFPESDKRKAKTKRKRDRKRARGREKEREREKTETVCSKT